MRVVLVRGNERVEIEGDDDYIREDLCYQGTFERKVAEISKLFYAKQEAPHGTDAE